jgi:hypothetical protein
MNIIKENSRVYQGIPGIEIAALKTIEVCNKAYTKKGLRQQVKMIMLGVTWGR